jgi:hypothetical protein
MCVITIIVALVSVTCPQQPAARDAAIVLAQSPGLSNRTNVHPVPEERRGPQVIVVERPTPSARPMVERDSARAIRMGIPGGWTPLEWATLHSEGRK